MASKTPITDAVGGLEQRQIEQLKKLKPLPPRAPRPIPSAKTTSSASTADSGPTPIERGVRILRDLHRNQQAINLMKATRREQLNAVDTPGSRARAQSLIDSRKRRGVVTHHEKETGKPVKFFKDKIFSL